MKPCPSHTLELCVPLYVLTNLNHGHIRFFLVFLYIGVLRLPWSFTEKEHLHVRMQEYRWLWDRTGTYMYHLQQWPIIMCMHPEHRPPQASTHSSTRNNCTSAKLSEVTPVHYLIIPHSTMYKCLWEVYVPRVCTCATPHKPYIVLLYLV